MLLFYLLFFCLLPSLLNFTIAFVEEIFSKSSIERHSRSREFDKWRHEVNFERDTTEKVDQDLLFLLICRRNLNSCSLQDVD